MATTLYSIFGPSLDVSDDFLVYLGVVSSHNPPSLNMCVPDKKVFVAIRNFVKDNAEHLNLLDIVDDDVDSIEYVALDTPENRELIRTRLEDASMIVAENGVKGSVVSVHFA